MQPAWRDGIPGGIALYIGPSSTAGIHCADFINRAVMWASDRGQTSYAMRAQAGGHSGLGELSCFFRKYSRHRMIDPAATTSGAPIHTESDGISSKNT